jgi:4'-phosphopantetheinyl transferase
MRIGERETHVWLLSCVLTDSVRSAFWGMLDDHERDRAGRFRFDVDRERFVARNGALRQLLGGYVGVPPWRVGFVRGPHGKPRLSNPDADRIEFNSSSSGEWAMVAVTRGRQVGIDIERIDASRSDPAMASHFFAPAERRCLERLDGDLWTDGFFNCWARKEAFVKATGEGLSRPLDDFEVSLHPGEPPRLLRVGADPGAASQWQMAELEPIAGYAHALVVAGEIGALSGLTWQSRDTGGHDEH